MVLSRLLYGLSTVWLNVAQIRRLNGFQARCLRQALGIKPAFYSRVPNRTVLEKAGQTPLGQQLLRQQLLLYGRVARAPHDDYLRKLTFYPGTLMPTTSKYVRRIGRPRNEWTNMLQKESYKIDTNADRLVHNVLQWAAAVERYCR